MSRALRTTLWVLGGIVAAVLLFGLGIQLYAMQAGPNMMGIGSGFAPMMRGAWGAHPFGGWMGVPFLGPLLGLGLVVLVVVGVMSLVGKGSGMHAAAAACTNCGSPVVAGWTFCPRCGQKI
jgi:hypothetical protein